jgi:alpha-tubulin suppressor-like RCC1 family protein
MKNRKSLLGMVFAMALSICSVAFFAPTAYGTGTTPIAAGDDHSLAIREDGTLWAWGQNRYGQLGDGTTINRHKPVQVLTDVVSVAAGVRHSLAIKRDGTLWAWGQNRYGQLGDGTTINRHKPVQVWFFDVDCGIHIFNNSVIGAPIR